ncbi:MAG: hypothetical protein ACLFTU_08375 [Puniceicoccaceae bacterium]
MKLWNANDLLQWESGEAGLPEIHFRADAPVCYPPSTPPPEGMEETDPWFILGNYGLTVFPHVSGGYQLFHTEHGYSRLNHDGGERITGRACRSTLRLDGVEHDLLDIPAGEKRFGCGMARWSYQIGGVRLSRRFDTLPSRDHRDRIPGFIITLAVENPGETPVDLKWTEGLGARYAFCNWNNPPAGRQQAHYPVRARAEGASARASFEPTALRPLVFNEPGALAQADAFPPTVHLNILEGEGTTAVEPESEAVAWLLAGITRSVPPGGSVTLRVAVGWSADDLRWEDTLAALRSPVDGMRAAWSERLPDFAEAEPATRAELQWHAYVLHAMATWDARYGCTYIPQGNLYEYALGSSSCTRDQAMHALPACTYDPDLARSVLSYLARITDPRGRAEHTNEGAGIYPVGGDQKSDNELFCLLLAAEYLERTGDAASLLETEPFFPPMGQRTPSGTLLERIGGWVTFLRDGVHVGKNGLVRIMLSDLSDTLHSAFPHLTYSHQSYRKVFDGESYVNTGMALNVLRRVGAWMEAHADELGDQAATARAIAAAALDLEKRLREALFSDLENRPWAPRGRVEDHVLGEDDAFAAPQIFLLSNPDLPEARRREIWDNVRPRVWDGEPFGVLLREGVGKHRCGMVWYAWSGMFITELADLDEDAAREGFERLSLRRRAERAPDQWVGLWSHSDCTWGYSLDWGDGKIPGTCRVGYMKPFPHFCAHVHAWPLMIWQRLHRES